MSMAIVNIIMRRKMKLLDMRIGSLLAIGSVVGGVCGNYLFTLVRGESGADALLGMVQAIALGLITGLLPSFTQSGFAGVCRHIVYTSRQPSLP